jgi:hypothetical protein
MEYPTFSKEDLKTIGVVFAIVLIAAPMIPNLMPASVRSEFSYLRYMPEAMIDTTLAGENAIGGTYLSAAYATRDLSAAAYGGIAQGIVGGLEAVHGVQMNAYHMAGQSMSDGANEVSAAYEAVGQWYGASDQRIEARLTSQP